MVIPDDRRGCSLFTGGDGVDEVETCDGLQSYNCSAAERLREQEPKTMRRNHQPVYTWHQHASSNHKSAARSGINTLKTH